MKKQFLSLSFVLIWVIFALHSLAMYFEWYSLIYWYDMMMHYLGGAWLGCVFYGFSFILKKYLPEKLFRDPSLYISLGLIFVFIVGFGWEIYEYIVQYLTRGTGIADPLDSLSDLFFDIVGGITSSLYAIIYTHGTLDIYEYIIRKSDEKA